MQAPSRRCRETTKTSPRHPGDTTKTPQRHHRDTKIAKEIAKQIANLDCHQDTIDITETPQNSTNTPPRHHRNTTKTPLTQLRPKTPRDHRYLETPRRHHRETTNHQGNPEMQARHLRNITETLARHHRDTTETSLRRLRDATGSHWDRDTAQAGSREPDGARPPLEFTTPSYR